MNLDPTSGVEPLQRSCRTWVWVLCCLVFNDRCAAVAVCLIVTMDECVALFNGIMKTACSVPGKSSFIHFVDVNDIVTLK